MENFSHLPQVKNKSKLINSETIKDYIQMKGGFHFNQTLADSVSVK